VALVLIRGALVGARGPLGGGGGALARPLQPLA
jgi:hypothetical protein